MFPPAREDYSVPRSSQVQRPIPASSGLGASRDSMSMLMSLQRFERRRRLAGLQHARLLCTTNVRRRASARGLEQHSIENGGSPLGVAAGRPRARGPRGVTPSLFHGIAFARRRG